MRKVDQGGNLSHGERERQRQKLARPASAAKVQDWPQLPWAGGTDRETASAEISKKRQERGVTLRQLWRAPRVTCRI
jgi:hypothetical protein